MHLGRYQEQIGSAVGWAETRGDDRPADHGTLRGLDDGRDGKVGRLYPTCWRAGPVNRSLQSRRTGIPRVSACLTEDRIGALGRRFTQADADGV